MNYRSIFLSFSPMLLTACASGGPKDAPPEVLNSPAFFEVGGRVFGARISEIGTVTNQSDCNCVSYHLTDDDDGSEAAKRLASDASVRSKPVRAGHIEIAPGNTYERLDVNSDCAMTSPSWGCRAKRLGIMHDLPKALTISDTKFLNQFKANRTVDTESQYDYLSEMTPFTATPKVKCDQSGKFCLATVALSSQVLVIWSVFPNSQIKETAAQIAERQGRAIWLMVNVS